jgi:hypothetical protein
MLTFSEFLRQQHQKSQIALAANEQILSEWRCAVERLLETFREWLAKSDPEGILQLQSNTCDIKEPSLGKYVMPRLDIHGLGKWIGIIPKARFTVATTPFTQAVPPQQATGRVDITDEIRRYVLYRLPSEQGDRWYIDDLNNEAQPLTQERFEQALMSYLR